MISFPDVVYFYSASFLLFYLVIFIVYWSLPRHKNIVLLIASYFFYSCWDIRFLSLILISTLVDFFGAKWIFSRPSQKKMYLYLSVGLNLGILGVFKYAQFFIDSAWVLLDRLGIGASRPVLEIILPLGISFYTFQSMSYVIDVYRGKCRPHEKLTEYALFVAFFPQLIAGPIEKANHLLGEILNEKRWRNIEWQKGIYLFAYGFFKKRVIADFLAYAVYRGYLPGDKAGILTLTGFIAYMFQVYGDVSGYADMARGMSLLFGIRLSSNFIFPYFSKDPVEFWKRWHITLSFWARHYVFTPLITRWKKPKLVIFATFIVMGIWHGPRWHYVHWGLYWAFWSVAYQSFLKRFWHPLFMVLVILIGQSFYRSDSIHAYIELGKSITGTFWSAEVLTIPYLKTYLVIALFMGYEAWCLSKEDEFRILKSNFYVRSAFFIALIFLYRNIGETAAINFVYFQF